LRSDKQMFDGDDQDLETRTDGNHGESEYKMNHLDHLYSKTRLIRNDYL
jgi:hypothetical protein